MSGPAVWSEQGGDVLINVSRSLVLDDVMKAAARSAPGGWLYAVDRHFDPAADVPVHGLIGAWPIDADGAIGAEFRYNPEYLPSPLERGWPAPCDGLDRTAQLAATGNATLDDVVMTLLFDEAFYAIEEDGTPALDDDGQLVVYSRASVRPDIPPDGLSWDRSTGRALAVRLASDAVVLVNPGSWEASFAAVDLIARAGGEASGYLLVERIEEFLAGELDGAALHAAFCGAQVFCAAGERPGFLAVEEGGDRVVPVFTSIVELARFAGQTAWLAALGQDVLNLLPDGCDIVVDPGTPRAVRLRGDATVQRDGDAPTT